MEREDFNHRFWSKVDIRGEDECWNWIPNPHSRYGKIKIDGKFESAHRIAYQTTHNDLMGDLEVLHKCDNKRCVNPKHLYAGTQSDNMRDRNERNPTPPELSAYGKAKLYSGEIWLVRKLKGVVSSRYAGKMFNISQRTILTIWNSNKSLCREGYYV